MLSLLTKETGMIFIFICPLFIFLFDYKLSKNQIYNLILFLLIPIIIYFILRSNSVSSINLKDYLQYSNFILDNIFFGVMIYINKVLYPIYVPIVLYEQSFNIHEIVIPIIFVIMLSIIYCRNIIKRKIFIFGLLMFLLYLLPTFAIGLNQILFHRLLIPSIGLLIIFINVIYKISNKYKILNKYFIFLWIFIFLFFSIASYLQADKYKDNNIFIVTGYTDAPKYGTFINAMAKIYIKYENYDKALYFLSKLDDISLDKSLVDVAVILCKKNKFKEAEEILKESIEKNYNVELCYANLSMIYENDKNYDKALEYALKSYEINSYNIDVSLNLARMYRLNNKFEEAIDIYKKLLKFDKKNSEYYYSLGVLYNDIKDKNNAVKFLETACRLDPNNKISSKKLEEVKNII
jgi:tetratricopeptide (TPR) repeat protein